MAGDQWLRKLSISIKNTLILHLSTFIVIAIGLLVLYYIQFDKYIVQVFIIIWILNFLPAIYLHFKSYAINKGEEYELYKFKLIKRKNNIKKTYSNKEIKKIIFYVYPNRYQNSNIQYLTIEKYYYAIIQLKGGEELILTSLLDPRLDRSLRKLKGG